MWTKVNICQMEHGIHTIQVKFLVHLIFFLLNRFLNAVYVLYFSSIQDTRTHKVPHSYILIHTQKIYIIIKKIYGKSWNWTKMGTKLVLERSEKTWKIFGFVFWWDLVGFWGTRFRVRAWFFLLINEKFDCVPAAIQTHSYIMNGWFMLKKIFFYTLILWLRNGKPSRVKWWINVCTSDWMIGKTSDSTKNYTKRRKYNFLRIGMTKKLLPV